MIESGERDDLFRGLLEAAPDAMVIVDRDGTIVLINAQAERLFGHARGDLLGQPVEKLVPERFRGRHGGHRQGFFAEPKVRAMGSGLALHGVRDLTERRRADAGRFQLAAIVDSSDDAIIGKTLEGVHFTLGGPAEVAS